MGVRTVFKAIVEFCQLGVPAKGWIADEPLCAVLSDNDGTFSQDYARLKDAVADVNKGLHGRDHFRMVLHGDLAVDVMDAADKGDEAVAGMGILKRDRVFPMSYDPATRRFDIISGANVVAFSCDKEEGHTDFMGCARVLLNPAINQPYPLAR